MPNFDYLYNNPNQGNEDDGFFCHFQFSPLKVFKFIIELFKGNQGTSEMTHQGGQGTSDGLQQCVPVSQPLTGWNLFGLPNLTESTGSLRAL